MFYMCHRIQSRSKLSFSVLAHLSFFPVSSIRTKILAAMYTMIGDLIVFLIKRLLCCSCFCVS